MHAHIVGVIALAALTPVFAGGVDLNNSGYDTTSAAPPTSPGTASAGNTTVSGSWSRLGAGLRRPCEGRAPGKYCIGWNGVLSCPDAQVTLCPNNQWCQSQLQPGQWNMYCGCQDPAVVQQALRDALDKVNNQWNNGSNSTFGNNGAVGSSDSPQQGAATLPTPADNTSTTTNVTSSAQADSGSTASVASDGSQTVNAAVMPGGSNGYDVGNNTVSLASQNCTANQTWNATANACMCISNLSWNDTLSTCMCTGLRHWNSTRNKCLCMAHAAFSLRLGRCKCMMGYVFQNNRTKCRLNATNSTNSTNSTVLTATVSDSNTVPVPTAGS